MILKFKPILLLVTILLTSSCGFYSFTGINTDAKTIKIDFFPNNAILVEPTLSPKFTQNLKDLFTRQSNLSIVKSEADLIIEGEIVDYKIMPTAITNTQSASQNRLTIVVNVRFFNQLHPEEDFEKKFSHYYDYPANDQLIGNSLEAAFEEILERIHQNIFTETIARW